MLFQQRDIKWEYVKRGKIPLTKTKIMQIKTVFNQKKPLSKIISLKLSLKKSNRLTTLKKKKSFQGIRNQPPKNKITKILEKAIILEYSAKKKKQKK